MRPGRNAALQIDHWRKTILKQVLSDLTTACTVVTKAGNGTLRRQFSEAGGQFTHGNADQRETVWRD